MAFTDKLWLEPSMIDAHPPRRRNPTAARAGVFTAVFLV